MSTNNVSSDTIAFVQYHEPPLKSGEYTLALDQNVSVPSGSHTDTETYSTSKKFYVAGERFNIPPQLIHSQFPPPHNYGDHSNVLPHILLNRSTLPWERDADPDDSELPWLWLFIYDDQDLAAGRVQAPAQVSVSSVTTFLDPGTMEPLPSSNANSTNSHSPELVAEPGEDLAAQVCVVKAQADWLQNSQIVPSSAALKLLTSVRSNEGGSSSEDSEWAICVANRMPLAGGNSYAHLVTLENRFSNGSFDFSQGLDSDRNLSFISLAQWRFSCPDDISYAYNTKTLAKLNVAGVPQTLINLIQQLPENQLYESTATFTAALGEKIPAADQSSYQQWQAQILKAMQMPTATFKGLLEQVNTGDLQLPLLANTKYLSNANHYIKRGAVVLPHLLRQGGQTQSWYHGPLLSGTDPDTITADDSPVSLPVTASDQLLRFDTNLGMFDTSYAAAWELGRMLCLNNCDIAMSLFAWKRQNAWELAQQEQALLYDHLPFSSSSSGSANADNWDKLSTWFNDLNLLYQVPFNYLVPDQRLLPNESIRFFNLDQLWIECLLDGAFSIGRVTTAELNRDEALSAQLKDATYPKITGFLLRSEVVSGWPALEINGSSEILTDEQMPESTEPLTILRRSTLAPNLLLCLFSGTLKTVDIHLKAEALHFGFDRPFGSQTSFYKELKNLSTGELISPVKSVNNQWLAPLKTETNVPAARVVDVVSINSAIADALNQTPADFTSAQFALEMIEGIPRIRFSVAS